MAEHNGNLADFYLLGESLNDFIPVLAVQPKPMFFVRPRLKVVIAVLFPVNMGERPGKGHHVAGFVKVWIKGIAVLGRKHDTTQLERGFKAIFLVLALLLRWKPIFGGILVTEYRTGNLSVQGIAFHIGHDAVERFQDGFLPLVLRGCVVCRQVAETERHGAIDDKFLNGDGDTGDFLRSVIAFVL